MDVVEYLVGVGKVDVNKADFTSHQTVLHIAVGSTLTSKTTAAGMGVVPFLLNHQADASIRNRNGKTCFDLMKVVSSPLSYPSLLPPTYPTPPCVSTPLTVLPLPLYLPL